MDLTKKTNPPSNPTPHNQGPSNNGFNFQILKKAIWFILVIILAVAWAYTYMTDTTTEDRAKAEEIGNQILAEFNSGAPMYYTEKYNSDTTGAGEYIFARDSQGNLFKSDIGDSPTGHYEYIEYRVDDVYYFTDADGAIYESSFADYDPEAYFNEQITYVASAIQYTAIDTFSTEFSTEITKDTDNYIVTGMYEDENLGGYTLTIAKDGSSFSYVDKQFEAYFNLNYEDTIVLPN